MDNRVKKELDKMFLLMERMDNHYTLDESLEMEDRIEHKRDTYTDLDQFLADVKLNKSFVGLGYVQGYSFKKIYPTKPDVDSKLGMSQSDAIKAGFSKMDKSKRGWGKLNSFVNGSEFTNPTGRKFGGFNSMINPFAGILKVTNYVFNWTNDVIEKNQEASERIKNARLTAGFGKNDADYGPDDWRRNKIYKGIGASPEITGSKNGYPQRLNNDNPLFGQANYDESTKTYIPVMSTRPDGTQYQKRAFRFNMKNVDKQWATFYLVDGNGDVDDIDTSLGAVLGDIPTERYTDYTKYIEQQMSQEEKTLLATLAAEDKNRALASKQWITDNISYIVAGEYDIRTNTTRYVRYINPDIIIDPEKVNVQVNQKEFKDILDKEIKETEVAVRYKTNKTAAE